LQPLIGKPLAMVSDARLSGKADGQVVVERLLSISGEDALTIDRKYRESWTGRLPTRFVILTNELPRLSDSSGALASRFVMFVLNKSFLGKEDPGLTEKLLGERSGIFNWALAGLDRLSARGYFLAPESGTAALQQLEDLSSPVSSFIRDRCRLGAGETVPVDDLWQAWKQWCMEDNRHPGIKAVFGRDLSSAAPSVQRTRPRAGEDRRYVYQGLGLESTGGNTIERLWDHRDQNVSGLRGPRSPGMYSQPGGDSSDARARECVRVALVGTVVVPVEAERGV
jgi:putative DNA primase/helicase